jgi:hypothetical protein
MVQNNFKVSACWLSSLLRTSPPCSLHCPHHWYRASYYELELHYVQNTGLGLAMPNCLLLLLRLAKTDSTSVTNVTRLTPAEIS